MDDINFSKDTDLLNSTYCSNDSTNLSTIYNYHKTYTELCLKYNRNLNKVFWQNDYYLSSQSAYNNYHKSIYIINHISVNLNKLILDIYIIEDNYFISEDYILNILGDTYIQNYLTRVYNINLTLRAFSPSFAHFISLLHPANCSWPLISLPHLCPLCSFSLTCDLLT